MQLESLAGIWPANMFSCSAFEASHHGSWNPVECVKISRGRVLLRFEHDEFDIEENKIVSSLRLRSRKARPCDCHLFLKPGTDICVFSSYPNAACLPAWHDAKIISIVRKTHGSQCKCLYFVSFYKRYDPRLKRNSGYETWIKEVSFDSIAILQRLNRKYFEDGSDQSSVEDNPFVNRNRLFSGNFLCETAWLVVLSTLRGIDLEIRVLQQKLVYLVLNGGVGNKAIRFKRRNGVLKPKMEESAPLSSELVIFGDDIIEEGPLDVILGNEISGEGCDFVHLRRSKRRRLRPDRFVSFDDFPAAKHSIVDIERLEEGEMPFATQSPNEDELFLLTGEEGFVEEFAGTVDKNGPRQKFSGFNSFKEDNSYLLGWNNEREKSDNAIIGEFKDLKKLTKGNRHQIGSSDFIGESKDLNKLQKIKRKKIGSSDLNMDKNPTTFQMKPILDQNDPYIKIGGTNIKPSRTSFNSNKRRSRLTTQEDKLQKLSCRKPLRYLFTSSSKRERFGRERVSRKHFCSGSEFKQMIGRCMKKLENEMKLDLLPSNQRETNQAKKESNIKLKFKWYPSVHEQVKAPEHEDLWKEMDNALFELYSLDATQDSHIQFSRLNTNGSVKDNAQMCPHEYKLDEQVGLICQLCHTVGTDIGCIAPPFVETNSFIRDNQQICQDKVGFLEDFNLDSDPFSNVSSPILNKCSNVWNLIPDLKTKMHTHQKKAFEFMWRNFMESLNPSYMEKVSKSLGGCVISHSPGSGKTLTVISFLLSYLKLFPRKRALILVPKTTLYVWTEEFKKWGVPFPVYEIHARRSYRAYMKNSKGSGFCRYVKINVGLKHVMDCLEKLYKWHKHPSALLMTYSSFFQMACEEKKSADGLNVASALKESPGIMILDEGHNPRSTRSKLRKTLMEVNTESRILLSGTLFQNNFEEYFNTLCLARPSFIYEVLKEFNPSMAVKVQKSSNNQTQKHSRKCFVENIAKRINSNTEAERKLGLDMLNKITSGFVDVYNIEYPDKLPGLQSYTILMKSHDIQEKILFKLQQAKEVKRHSFELDILITVGAMHPWLIKTISCVGKFFSSKELENLEYYKLDIKKGSKVTFVVDLVRQCVVRREKILIFCHYIPPINLLVEIFGIVFGWKKGEDVLVLQGEQSSFERGVVMDKFKQNDGPAQVLIASTSACAEGINLTAASRVILLDPEWNPSKTKQAIARAFRPGQKRVVYVYQLLASATLEEEKYGRTALKEWQSRMIFTDGVVEDSKNKKTENIDDEVLRHLVENDSSKVFETILKHEKGCHNMI